MKKTRNDMALKKVLSLKEDYLLKMDDLEEDATLNFKEADEVEDQADEETTDDQSEEDDDTASEENADDETSEEQDDEEAVDEPEEQKKSYNDKSKEKEDKAKTPSKAERDAKDGLYVVGLTDIYDKMQSAKTPADVGLALKAFLQELQKSSEEGLTKFKDNN